MILKMCWHILTFVAKEGNFLFTSGTEKLCSTMWGKTRYAHYMHTTKDTLQWTTTLLFFEEHDFDFMAIIYRAYVGIHWCMKNLYHKHHYTSFLLTMSFSLCCYFYLLCDLDLDRTSEMSIWHKQLLMRKWICYLKYSEVTTSHGINLQQFIQSMNFVPMLF